jgi:hypothetical protein
VRSNARGAIPEKPAPGRSVLFAGHWGFQYYMEELGALPMDLREQPLQTGDMLVLPNKNTGIPLPPRDPQAAELLGRQSRGEPFGVHTWAPRLGASFYGSNRGPMPWAIGDTLPDVCRTWRIKTPTTLHVRPTTARE